MKQYEPYKRLIRIGSALSVIGLETAIYWYVWNGYYNRILEYPFWRRGNWLAVALYGCIFAFFLHTYGGLKIGYLKTGNLMCSQLLSLIFVNIITYFQISLIDKKFHSIKAIAVMTVVQILTAALWIWLFQRIYRHLFPPRRLLLVSGDRPAFHLMEKVHSRKDKYYLAGAMHIRMGIRAIMDEAEHYDAVIIGDIPAQKRNELMKQCFEKNIRTYTVPKISDILLRTSSELDIFDSPLLLSKNEGLSAGQRLVKRAVDLAASGIGLIVTAPFFLIIAAAIKLTDGGPVFYCQERLTVNRQPFYIRKFRTMVQDAEKKGGAQLASENDSRILPVGKFLRKTRLDELPQLINIWNGEMSLVGPRPERPELAEKIEKEIPEFSYRLKVKAGLTGYAQIYGKYNTTPYDKLKLDLTYIRNYSLFLDLKLILMTPKIMMLKESTEGIKKEEPEEQRRASWKNS